MVQATGPANAAHLIALAKGQIKVFDLLSQSNEFESEELGPSPVVPTKKSKSKSKGGSKKDAKLDS